MDAIDRIINVAIKGSSLPIDDSINWICKRARDHNKADQKISIHQDDIPFIGENPSEKFMIISASFFLNFDEIKKSALSIILTNCSVLYLNPIMNIIRRRYAIKRIITELCRLFDMCSRFSGKAV
jgi:hypothetical protein